MSDTAVAEPKPPKINAHGEVRCSKCEEYYPPDLFSRSRSGKFMAWCKPCMAAHNRAARQRAKAA